MPLLASICRTTRAPTLNLPTHLINACKPNPKPHAAKIQINKDVYIYIYMHMYTCVYIDICMYSCSPFVKALCGSSQNPRHEGRASALTQAQWLRSLAAKVHLGRSCPVGFQRRLGVYAMGVGLHMFADMHRHTDKCVRAHIQRFKYRYGYGEDNVVAFGEVRSIRVRLVP